MSIRIQNDGLAGASSPGIGRTDEVSLTSSPGKTSSGRAGQAGGDSVDLSSLSQSLHAASMAQDAQQAGKIAHLAALYSSGQYNIDSNQVSRAMVSQGLGEVSGEKF